MNSMLVRVTGILAAATISIGALMAAPLTFAQSTPAANDGMTQRQANRKLAHDVRKALEKARLNVDDIRILARDGGITLDGTVPDGDDATKVPAIAGKVPGVTSVASNVSVHEVGH